MVTLIALFFPAVLSVWIWEAVSKASVSNRKCAYLYSLNVILINFACFALKRWVRHTGDLPLGDMTPKAAINYMVVAVVIAVTLALVEVFLYKRVRIQVESTTNCEDGTENEENCK